MLRWTFLFLWLVNPLTLWAEGAETPVSYQGRVRPLTAVKKIDNQLSQEQYLILPARKKTGVWYPLSALRTIEGNFTLYPDTDLQEIRTAYFNADPVALEKALRLGYQKIVHQEIQKGQPFPSLAKLHWEAVYYKYPWIIALVLGYAAASVILLTQSWKIGTLLLGTTIFLHTLILAIRCWILNRPPVTNMGETLLFVPWVIAVVGLVFSITKREWSIPFCACASASVLLLLNWISGVDTMDVVQPVLNSQYWLTVHVLMVVGSYGMFALASALGHFQFLVGSKSTKGLLTTLYIGVAMLIVGTVLGGVWAAQSWGRFWDWDPKEAWAFISICVYLLFIHSYRFGKISSWGLRIGAIIGFLFISFTWYGVNYLLGTGLHSYGFGNGGEVYYLIFLAVEAVFISLILLQKKGKNRMDGNKPCC